MMLSTRTKEATKTALAMTITYGIALSMDWDKPYWAAFAVAMISLSTVGQSLNKGAMRMLGTLVAVVVSLTLLALFPQERWWFMVALSVFVGLCTYLMGGQRRQYFWQVAGFVTVIICLSAGTTSASAFDTALLRAEETGLGILVYSLVTVLLWPSSTRDQLDAAVRALATTQHTLYRRYRDLLHGKGKAEDARALRMQEVQEFNEFSQALAAARTDSYQVWEVRRQWQQVQDQAGEVMETLELWRESFSGVQGLDMTRLLPHLDPLGEELDDRFAQIERMLGGEAPEREPQDVDLPLDKAALAALSHFQKAALAVTRTRLQHLDKLTRSLFETLADVKGFASAPAQADTVLASRPRFVPDLDRMAAAVSVVVSLWLAYLVWIYTGGEVPGGIGFVIMTVPIGMVLTAPQASVSLLYMPVAVGTVFASLLYIFVMPKLSSFMGLGLMIFAATFSICYLYAAPRQAIGRILGLVMFVTIAGISNEQSYDFLNVANTAFQFVFLFALLAFTAYIPVSQQPEKVVLRQLGRFFRSCEYLMTTMRWDITMTPTRLDRWRRAFHDREVETLPRKLAVWGKAVDTKALGGTSADQVLELTSNTQALAYRMQELMDAREAKQSALLVQEMLTDVRAWRLKVQDAFQGWSRDAEVAPAEVLRQRLTARLGDLERRIEETLNTIGEGKLSDQEREDFYRLLGAYRGLSEAALDYATTVDGIDWSRWRESRF